MEINKQIDNYVDKYINESWAYIPRKLFIHKLTKWGKYTEKNLEALKTLGVLKNTKEVYIYSFTHPDSNNVVSLTGGYMLKPGLNIRTWYTYVSPVRILLYKGDGVGLSGEFSSERIQEKKIKTQAFLFSGETVEFTKVADIQTEIISTTIPFPIVVGTVLYENIRIRCDKNNLRLNTVQFKRIKAITIPQVLTKANYLYLFSTKTT